MKAWESRRSKGDKKPETDRRESEADQAAGKAKHDALDEELGCNRNTARSQGKTDADFLLAIFGSDQEQIGEVRRRIRPQKYDGRRWGRPGNCSDC